MEAPLYTATQARLLQQPQLGLGRLSRIPLKCSSPRTAATVFIIQRGFSSMYCEPLRSWKSLLRNRAESKPIDTAPPHSNSFVGVPAQARWAALLLSKALFLFGIGLGATSSAMAKTAPPPASEVLVQKAVEKATHKTAEKATQLGSQNESAENSTSSATEKVAQVGSKSEGAPLLGEEFWKDMDLYKGSIITVLKKILDSDPTNLDALECLAKTLVDNDNPSRALIVIQKLELLEPGEMEWKYLKAVAYDMDGQFQLAKNIFEDILKIEPFSSKAIQGLMMAMDELGETDAVVEVAEEAMVKAREEKNVTEARNIGMLIGQYFMMKGHLYDALEHYDEMMQEDSKDFRPHLCQGIIYSAMGEKAKAEKHFKAYEKLCPKDYADKKYLDALMLKAKEEGQSRFELKQKEKYFKPFHFEKGGREQSSDK